VPTAPLLHSTIPMATDVSIDERSLLSLPCEARTDARHQRRTRQRLLGNPDYQANGIACKPPKLQATLGTGLLKAPGTHAAGCSNDHHDHNGMPDYLDCCSLCSAFFATPGVGPLLPKSTTMTILRPASGLIADPPARERFQAKWLVLRVVSI